MGVEKVVESTFYVKFFVFKYSNMDNRVINKSNLSLKSTTVKLFVTVPTLLVKFVLLLKLTFTLQLLEEISVFL